MVDLVGRAADGVELPARRRLRGNGAREELGAHQDDAQRIAHVVRHDRERLAAAPLGGLGEIAELGAELLEPAALADRPRIASRPAALTTTGRAPRDARGCRDGLLLWARCR